MTQLMRQDMSKEHIEAEVLLVRLRQHPAGDWYQYRAKFCLLNVLQHHALRSLLLDDPLIIRQIECGGANPMRRISSREDLVDNANRRRSPQLRIAVFLVDRQVVLDVLKVR